MQSKATLALACFICGLMSIHRISAQLDEQGNCGEPNRTALLMRARGLQMALERVTLESLALVNITDSSVDHCLETLNDRKASRYNSARAACPW